jgi:hypothetical protein
MHEGGMMKRKDMAGKAVKNIYTGKKSMISRIEILSDTNKRVWLTSGLYISKKGIKDYQIYDRGWKPLKVY